MDVKAAELIGMHVGDGTLYLAGKTLVWEMRGSVNEKEYYEDVSNLIEKLLGIKLFPKYRGPNSYGLQTTNKIVTNFFITNGFNPGKKVYTVRIPEYIKNSQNLEVKRAFIRGLFDTDGCIRFEKNRTEYNYYPRIEFNFASVELVKDLDLLLKELGFKTYSWKDRDNFHIGLAGFGNLDKWVNGIYSSNPKNIFRIKRGVSNRSKVNLKIRKHKP